MRQQGQPGCVGDCAKQHGQALGLWDKRSCFIHATASRWPAHRQKTCLLAWETRVEQNFM